MDLSPAAKPPAAVVDASFLVGFCAEEPGKYAAAKQTLLDYVANGWRLFAPHLLVGEALFALCRQVQEAKLTVGQHTQAVSRFTALTAGIFWPSGGDADLISRAEGLRGSKGCSHMSDSFYLALAQLLMAERQVELVTFDDGWTARAGAHAIPVKVLPVRP